MLAPAALTFGLACWGLGRPSMYGTETVTYRAAHLPMPSFLHLLSHVDAVHGVYYAFMHVMFLVGHGTVALRLPSTIAMATAVALTGRLAQRLTGSNRVALFAGLSMFTVPYLDRYAQGGRSYAIDTAAVLWCSLMLLRAMGATENAARCRWLAYGASLAVAGYLHEMTALVIISHGVTLWWARADRDVVRRWLRAVLGAVIAMVPIVILGALQVGQLGWIQPATFGAVWQLVAICFGPAVVVIAINLVLLTTGVATDPGLRRSSSGVTLVRFALPLLVLPPAIVLTESAFAHPFYGGARYFLYCIAGSALLVGAGLERAVRAVQRWQPTNRTGWVLGCAVMAVLLTLQWPLQERLRTASGAVQDTLALSVYLEHHARSGDGVIFLPRSFAAASFVYRNDYSALDDVAVATSPARSGTLYGTDKSPSAMRHAVVAESRMWLVGFGLPRYTTRPELVALEHDFHVVLVHRVTGVRITLFQRNGPASRDRHRYTQ